MAAYEESCFKDKNTMAWIESRNRSSCPEVFCKKGVLCNFVKFTGKHLWQTVCSYHVTYAFQSESTLDICLNVKELLARSRRKIWSLSDCCRTRTYNHLVRKRPLNHLAKCSHLIFARVSFLIKLQALSLQLY